MMEIDDSWYIVEYGPDKQLSERFLDKATALKFFNSQRERGINAKLFFNAEVSIQIG